MNIEKYITKTNNCYFLDTDAYNAETDIPVENGDIFRFIMEDKRYIGKVVEKFKGDGLFELQIVSEKGNI